MKSSPFCFPPELKLKSLSRYCRTICWEVGRETIHLLNLSFLILKQSGLFWCRVPRCFIYFKKEKWLQVQTTYNILNWGICSLLLNVLQKLKPCRKNKFSVKKIVFFLYLVRAIRFPFLYRELSWQEIQWFWLNCPLKPISSNLKDRLFKKTCYGNGEVV